MIVIEENISLRPFNTFGLQANARIFAEASTIEDLKTLVGIFRDNPLPKLILGGGSNLLFTNDFDGIVLYPNLQEIQLDRQDDDFVWVRAYAGTNWDKFVSLCVSKQWGGVENLSLIPGNVGACPVQNIGAYGVEVKDVIDSVEVMDITTGSLRNFTNAECEFGYRDSIFKRSEKNHYIVVSVIFKLSKTPELKINYKDVLEELKGREVIDVKAVREAILRIRRRKLPDHEKIGNAGSFFKNPVIDNPYFEMLKEKYPTISSYPAEKGKHKLAAAWLIEQCGWKGKSEGVVGTFETQPLVIVNLGDAKGIDIYEFAKKIQQSVLQTFGIELEMEVNIV